MEDRAGDGRCGRYKFNLLPQYVLHESCFIEMCCHLFVMHVFILVSWATLRCNFVLYRLMTIRPGWVVDCIKLASNIFVDSRLRCWRDFHIKRVLGMQINYHNDHNDQPDMIRYSDCTILQRPLPCLPFQVNICDVYCSNRLKYVWRQEGYWISDLLLSGWWGCSSGCSLWQPRLTNQRPRLVSASPMALTKKVGFEVQSFEFLLQVLPY